MKKMIDRYNDTVKILIGGGVRSGNIDELKSSTGGKRFHSAAILPYESFVNIDEIKKLKH